MSEVEQIVFNPELSQTNKQIEETTNATTTEEGNARYFTTGVEELSVSGTSSTTTTSRGVVTEDRSATTSTTDPKKRQVPHPEKSFALQINSFGEASVFTWREIATPKIVGPHDVIVKVVNTSVNPIDWKVRKGFMQVLEKPTFPHTLGRDFSGTIVAKGTSVNRFFLKDKVFGVVPHGAYAQYIRVNTEKDIIEKKPVSITHEEAAGAPLASLAAWHSLVELGNLPHGEKAAGNPKVLIIGASGGVGTFAVQLAKRANRASVTAVCSGKNAELVTRLGADRVIDYKQLNYVEVLKSEQDFDLVIDTIGEQGNYDKASTLLKKNGIYAAVATEINEQKLTIGDLAKFGATVVGRKIFGSRTYKPLLDIDRKDFPKVIPYLERREVITVIGERFSLQDGSKAHELSQSLHASGKIILKVS
ncbi:6733_t:CDS:2 [Ambispora leptoticha]|uniref:6733_t:CDS:1 n=1 Tax=Ambispora leptoticha TaxID=144679 RepID=A0A9N9F653_9GLOM|nr:6733_t:CDS:2 [Ambispora leptoticha]